MRRIGFTMIELVFVIVILGIMAAVAIPKLAATRNDASASTLATSVATCVSDAAGAYLKDENATLTDIPSCVIANDTSTGCYTISFSTNTLSVSETNTNDDLCAKTYKITRHNHISDDAGTVEHKF